jgi:hypothetical protein
VSFIERRRAHRFDLQSPVIVRWKDGAETREALTVSEDVSSNGLYFILPQGIKDGTPVEVEMTLPNQITLAGPVRVRCLGHIQRCEATEGAKSGMAGPSRNMSFCLATTKLPGREIPPRNRGVDRKAKTWRAQL